MTDVAPVDSPEPEPSAAIAGDDALRALVDAIAAADRASDLAGRLAALLDGVRALGFGRAALVVRDAMMEPVLVLRAGYAPGADGSTGADPVLPAVWRRWLRLFGRRREQLAWGPGYLFDLRDPWARAEFGVALGAPVPAYLYVVPLVDQDGRVLATLVLECAGKPGDTTTRAIDLAARHAAQLIARERLAELAGRRAERLQRLQEAGAALARSLHELEIMRELARQITRLVPLDGLVIAQPDLEHGVVRTGLRQVRGLARPRADQPLGSGVIAEVARTGHGLRIDEYDAAREPLAAADDVVGDGGPAGSVLAAPMRVGTQLVGVIAVHAAATGAYTAEDEELLRTVAAQAATAIANARLFAESEAERRQTEALAEVARAVGGSLRLGEVLRLLLRHTVGLLRAEGACVALRRDDYLHVVAAAGATELLAGVHLPLSSSMMGRAAREGRYLISNDVRADHEYYRPLQRIARLDKSVIVPLLTAEGSIGVLAAINRPADFTEADARVLQRLADQVAVAIVNARLFEEVTAATREWKVAFDAIAAGMTVLDEQGHVVRANTRAAELAGIGDVSMLVGHDLFEALCGAPLVRLVTAWPRAEADAPGAAPAGDGAEVHAADAVWRALERGETASGLLRVPERGRVFDVVAAPHPEGGAVVTFEDVTANLALAERYRRVVETTGDAVVITDEQGRISFANPAAHALFGRGADLLGAPAAELVRPEDAGEMEQRGALTRAGRPQRYEVVVRRPDGEERAVSVATAPLAETGTVTAVVASLRDVTDERRAREAVVASEARYRELFDAASDPIYTVDAQGVFTSVNAATCYTLGASREMLVGRRPADFIAPASLDTVRGEFAAVLAGETRRYEADVHRPDGEVLHLAMTNTPILRDGTVAGVLCVAHDVTVERARAAALARSEARYERLVQSASDAIFTVDVDGRFTAVNRALEHGTGVPRERLLGALCTALADGRDREVVDGLLAATLRGERVRREVRYRDASGRERWASVIGTPITENGVVTGALGVVRDVTDERRLAEQLLQREKLAAVGQLVSGVAHELNNPLAGVLAFSELLLGAGDVPPSDAAEVQEIAGTIHREAKRAARIVSKLLTFARQHPPQRAATDVNRVLLEALDLRRYALRVQQVDIAVELDYELPPTWADGHQLQQVFLNLITNAEHALARAPGDRRLVVRTRRVLRTAALDSPGAVERLVVTVADTGPGMSDAEAEHIFDPFYTTKPIGEGTGLGLSISEGIVREHGGRIRVETAPEEGATFVVELPLVRPPTDALPAPAERGAPVPVRAALPAGARRVLVVDDETAVADGIARYIASRGHAADVAYTGADALARIAAERYDAMFLDRHMPDLSGETVLAAVTARAPALAARTALVSGDVDDGRDGRERLQPRLRKPFLLEELGAVLDALLGPAAPAAHDESSEPSA